jgi:hypothetical protein
MKIRTAFATFFAIAFFTALPGTFASVQRIHPPMHAMFSNGQKNIKINLHNGTGAPLELKIGDKVTTLQTGTVMSVKLPVGTRITTDTATENHKVGDLIVEISEGMYNDSTLTIK